MEDEYKKFLFIQYAQALLQDEELHKLSYDAFKSEVIAKLNNFKVEL